MAGKVRLGEAGLCTVRSGMAGMECQKGEMNMVYEYKWDGYIFPVPAAVVGERCEAIEKQNGKVTRKALVDDARAEGAALHKLFEWDDAIAGEKYREHQAGSILSALKVVVQEKEQEEITVRAFVNVSATQKSEYVNVRLAMSEPDKTEVVLHNAMRELEMFERKYSALTQLQPIFAEFKELREKIAS